MSETIAEWLGCYAATATVCIERMDRRDQVT